MFFQEIVRNIEAFLVNFESQNGCRVDRMKINRSTGRTEDFRAIKDFIEESNIEIEFDDELPVNQFVFLNQGKSLPDSPATVN